MPEGREFIPPDRGAAEGLPILYGIAAACLWIGKYPLCFLYLEAMEAKKRMGSSEKRCFIGAEL
jgi:hypothetical protein